MATQLHTEIIPQVVRVVPPRSEKPKAKKKLVRRTQRDCSQVVRRGLQFAFLLVTSILGGVFYFWVRQFEPGGHANTLSRPAGVEGWLPIAGMMNRRYFLLTGEVPRDSSGGDVSAS